MTNLQRGKTLKASLDVFRHVHQKLKRRMASQNLERRLNEPRKHGKLKKQEKYRMLSVSGIWCLPGNSHHMTSCSVAIEAERTVCQRSFRRIKILLSNLNALRHKDILIQVQNVS